MHGLTLKAEPSPGSTGQLHSSPQPSVRTQLRVPRPAREGGKEQAAAAPPSRFRPLPTARTRACVLPVPMGSKSMRCEKAGKRCPQPRPERGRAARGGRRGGAGRSWVGRREGKVAAWWGVRFSVASGFCSPGRLALVSFFLLLLARKSRRKLFSPFPTCAILPLQFPLHVLLEFI